MHIKHESVCNEKGKCDIFTEESRQEKDDQ